MVKKYVSIRKSPVSTFLYRLGLSYKFIFSYLLSILIIYTTYFSKGYFGKIENKNFFIILNFIPFSVCFFYGISKFKLSNLQRNLNFAILEYLFLRTIFQILETYTFYEILFSVSFCIILRQIFHSEKMIIKITLIPIITGNFMLYQTIEKASQMGLLIMVFILVLYEFLINDKKKEPGKLLILSLFYFLDFYFIVFKNEFNKEMMKFPEIVYLKIVYCSCLFALYIFNNIFVNFSYCYCLVNFIAFLNFSYKIYKDYPYKFLMKAKLSAYLVLSFSYILLMKSIVKTRAVFVFPSRYTSLEDFVKFSFSQHVVFDSFDNEIIKIQKKDLISHSNSKSIVKIRIKDFKYIGCLYILTSICRSKRYEAFNFLEPDFVVKLNTFSKSFNKAFNESKSQTDDLYLDLENYITDIILATEENYIDIYDQPLYRMINYLLPLEMEESNFIIENHKFLARKLENDIRNKSIGDLIKIKLMRL